MGGWRSDNVSGGGSSASRERQFQKTLRDFLKLQQRHNGTFSGTNTNSHNSNARNNHNNSHGRSTYNGSQNSVPPRGVLCKSGDYFRQDGRDYRVSSPAPGDWLCNACGYPAVRSKRTTCHVCATPRPISPTFALPPPSASPLAPAACSPPSAPALAIVDVKRPPPALGGFTPPPPSASLSHIAVAAASPPAVVAPPPSPSPLQPVPSSTSVPAPPNAADTQSPENPCLPNLAILAATQLKLLQGVLATGCGVDESTLANIRQRINEHDVAVQAKRVEDDFQRAVKRNGNTPLHPDVHLTTYHCVIANCQDSIAKHKAKSEASATKRAEDHASSLRVLHAAIVLAQKNHDERAAYQAETDRQWADADAREAENLRTRLAAAQAALVQAQAAVDFPPTGVLHNAGDPTGGSTTTSHDVPPPPPRPPAQVVPSIRPLIHPPALTLHADETVKTRLLHARMIVDHYQQQDADLPLDLHTLQLSPRECATLVGEIAWAQAYGDTTPALTNPLPRFLIGVIGAALRQLEVDVAARSAAADAARVTLEQLSVAPHSPARQFATTDTAAQRPQATKRPADVAELTEAGLLQKQTKDDATSSAQPTAPNEIVVDRTPSAASSS